MAFCFCFTVPGKRPPTGNVPEPRGSQVRLAAVEGGPAMGLSPFAAVRGAKGPSAVPRGGRTEGETAEELNLELDPEAKAQTTARGVLGGP